VHAPARDADRGDNPTRCEASPLTSTLAYFSAELALEGVPLNGSHNEPSEAPNERYLQLSQLVQQYELGAVSHRQFERIKKGILLGETLSPDLRSPRMEMIVATYSQPDHVETSLESVLTLSKESEDAIIDGALLLRSRSAPVRIRSIAGLTRTPETGGMSVIICLCSLLFAPGAIQVDSNQAGWSESIGHMARHGIADTGLRKLGEGLPSGSQSISVVYWSSKADEIASAFLGFDDFARRILDDVVVDALTEVLVRLPDH